VAKRLTSAVCAVAEAPAAVNGNRRRRTVRRDYAEPQATALSPYAFLILLAKSSRYWDDLAASVIVSRTDLEVSQASRDVDPASPSEPR
jgi:hypothetical protein